MQVVEISSRKFSVSDAQRLDVKEKVKKMQKEGEKMVKGLFEFVDAGGGTFEFAYRFFKGEPIRTIHIEHGEIIDVPMIVVKHLNNIYKRIRMAPKEVSDKGKIIIPGSITKISRVRFTPVEFLDSDLYESGTA